MIGLLMKTIEKEKEKKWKP